MTHVWHTTFIRFLLTGSVSAFHPSSHTHELSFSLCIMLVSVYFVLTDGFFHLDPRGLFCLVRHFGTMKRKQLVFTRSSPCRHHDFILYAPEL